MKVLIAGASGLVGNNCLTYFTQQGFSCLGTHFSYATKDTYFFNTLSLDDKNNVDIYAFKPDVIVHCGALTHVDYCEDHVDESYLKTVTSTQNLIQVAKQLQAKFVYISTDYVFDGKNGPYLEDDAVNPLGIYAKHKLEAEQLAMQYADSLILRITNVYGQEERNKNFVSRIIEQCVEQKKLILKLPYDQYATPVNAWDIARAMYLLLRDKHKGVFHIASSDWMNRVELAQNILKHFPHADYELYPMDTASLNQASHRPLRGGLLKEKFSSLYPDFLFSTVEDFVLNHKKSLSN
ncbi:MAG: SDR family oxidoreductase [Chitinophagaceae bacterium]